MREGYLPDSDEFLTVDDALRLLSEYAKRRFKSSADLLARFSREKLELDLCEEYERGTVALQDAESMRIGNPSKHQDATRKRVTTAIKSSPLAAVSASLWISFPELEEFSESCFIPFEGFDKFCADCDFAIYDVKNELGYTIRGAAKALAEKYAVSERAMKERIFNAAEHGKLQFRDPQTGLLYTPKDRSDDHERISVSDLNQWLEESGVEYRIGDDDADSATSTVATPRRGIGRKRVMQIFRVDSKAALNHTFWDDKLARPPDWLEGARTVRGRPGVSSLWDPILVAGALLQRECMTLPQLDAALKEHLPGLFEQWEEVTYAERHPTKETDD